MFLAELACRYALVDSLGFITKFKIFIGMYVGFIELQIIKGIKFLASILFYSDMLVVCIHNLISYSAK